jgi:hypothetical protein
MAPCGLFTEGHEVDGICCNITCRVQETLKKVAPRKSADQCAQPRGLIFTCGCGWRVHPSQLPLYCCLGSPLCFGLGGCFHLFCSSDLEVLTYSIVSSSRPRKYCKKRDWIEKEHEFTPLMLRSAYPAHLITSSSQPPHSLINATLWAPDLATVSHSCDCQLPAKDIHPHLCVILTSPCPV